MIIGIGTDLVEIDRIKGIQQRLGDRFAKRILTIQELNLYIKRNRCPSYLALRFAAKEATAKALKTGIGKVSFLDIDTFHDEAGAPKIHLANYASIVQKEKGITHIHLSLSDEMYYAMAFVVAENNS